MALQLLLCGNRVEQLVIDTMLATRDDGDVVNCGFSMESARGAFYVVVHGLHATRKVMRHARVIGRGVVGCADGVVRWRGDIPRCGGCVEGNVERQGA